MRTQTKSQIIEIISKNGYIQVKELVQMLGITQAAVHRALNKLIHDQVLIKKGRPPKVFYFLKEPLPQKTTVKLSEEQHRILQEHYVYISPSGKIETGLDGFLSWMHNTQNQQSPELCVQNYIKVLDEAQSHINKKYDLIEATDRFNKIFPTNHLEKVFYQDFYSLIQFGKTKLGQYLLNGKQSQNKAIIKYLAEIAQPSLQRIIQMEDIHALAWVPHSIPRIIPFLKELEKYLNLNLPKVEIVKTYSGEIPIAQKSLAKLKERVQNARETMVVVPLKIEHQNVLLIDDAVGSGATLNEVAGKLKARGAKKIIGYAIVGSYKGFEVIREV